MYYLLGGGSARDLLFINFIKTRCLDEAFVTWKLVVQGYMKFNATELPRCPLPTLPHTEFYVCGLSTQCAFRRCQRVMHTLSSGDASYFVSDGGVVRYSINEGNIGGVWHVHDSVVAVSAVEFHIEIPVVCFPATSTTTCW